MLDRFVGSKSRSVSRDFEKNPAWLAEIDRVKILSIDHWGDVQTEINKLIPPMQLLFFVCTTKRNVMDSSRRIDSELSIRPLNQIDRSACRFLIHRKSSTVIFVAD